MNQAHSTFAALALAGAVAMGAHANGVVEVPANGALVSGIGAISGWHCTADVVELVIDGGLPIEAATGTNRPDTIRACGNDGLNGFSLTVGWGLWGEGEHTIDAYADGVLFSRGVFRTPNETDMILGRESQIVTRGFPNPGDSHILEWSPGSQSWQILQTVEREEISDWVGIEGNYYLDVVMIHFHGVGVFDNRLSVNTPVSGSLTIDRNGKFRQTIQIRNNRATVDGVFLDNDVFLEVRTDSGRTFSPLLGRGQTLTYVITGEDYTEVNTWARIQPVTKGTTTVRRAASRAANDTRTIETSTLGLAELQ